MEITFQVVVFIENINKSYIRHKSSQRRRRALR